MKTYTLNTESPEKWGIEAYNGMVIDEDEVKRLAKEWSISIEELLKDLDETEEENSMEFILSTDIELADVQQVTSALEEKIDWYQANYPYATYEISEMETALHVLNDLEYDIANMD